MHERYTFAEERIEKPAEDESKEDKSEEVEPEEQRNQLDAQDPAVGGATGCDGQEEEESEVKVYGKNEAPQRAQGAEGTDMGETRDSLTLENIGAQGHKKKHSKSRKKVRVKMNI